MSKRVRMCANCKHWDRLSGALVCPSGVCTLTSTRQAKGGIANSALHPTLAVAKVLDAGVPYEAWAALVTRPDFACSQFEKAEP